MTIKDSGLSAGRGCRVIRDYDVSVANTAKTVSTVAGETRRIVSVTVTYSAPVTVNVDITVNSGAGAAYDNLVQTIALSGARWAYWTPNKKTILLDDDALDVLAPAGGAGITSAIAIVTEVL